MNEDDNKSPKEGEANNKAEAKEPNFPEIDKGQVDKEKQETEPQDPELKKWIEETKDLPNAYKRVQGAESEVEKYREQFEKAQKEKDEFQQQVAQELKAVYEKDPETASKLFGYDDKGNPIVTQEKKTEQPLDASAIAQEAARQAHAKIEVDNFYRNNTQYIKDEADWATIQSIALKFVGEKDSDGNPYNIQTALKDALLIRHKELIGDDAVTAHLSAQAKRSSATEPGDISNSSGSGDVEITDEEAEMARQMGVDIEKLKERKRKQQG